MTARRSFSLVLTACSLVFAGCEGQHAQLPDSGTPPAAVDGAATATPDAPDGPVTVPTIDASSPDTPFPIDASPAPDAVSFPDAGPLPPNSIELVGPSVCDAYSPSRPLWIKCSRPTITIPAHPIPSRGPVQTRITRHVAGDCSTRFPLVVALRIDDDPERVLSVFPYYLDDEGLILRRLHGEPATMLAFQEASEGSYIASYVRPCRVWLEVEFNEPIPES